MSSDDIFKLIKYTRCSIISTQKTSFLQIAVFATGSPRLSYSSHPWFLFPSLLLEPFLLLFLGSFFLVYYLFFRRQCSGDFLRKGTREVNLHVNIFKIIHLLFLMGSLAGYRILIMQDISLCLFASFVAIENFDPFFFCVVLFFLSGNFQYSLFFNLVF